jgi:hypothetical protein
MPDMLATGSAWLTSQMKAHVATSIVYRRGTASVTISNATLGSSSAEVLEQGQMLVRKETQDFIIDAAQLVLNSVTVKPEEGDTIDRTVGEETWRYEVMPLLPLAAPWRYADPPYNLRLRVHSGKVKVV